MQSATFKVENPVYTHVFPEPVRLFDELVDELPVRKPTGLDMLEVGTPVLFDSDTGKAELDIPKCYAMAERLTGVPRRGFYSVDVAEMHDLFWLIASFFMKGRQTLLPAIEKQKAELLARAASPGLSPDDSTPASP